MGPSPCVRQFQGGKVPLLGTLMARTYLSYLENSRISVDFADTIYGLICALIGQGHKIPIRLFS